MPETHTIIRLFRLAWRIATIGVCSWGLAVLTGIAAGSFNPGLLCYYTVQSNIVCLIYATVLAIADIAGKRIRYERAAGAVTIMITVTMLVYNLVLDRSGFSMTGNDMEIANLIVHLVLPLMILADWLFFAQKGLLRAREPFFWTIIPVSYYLYILARAEISGLIPGRNTRFPYFFIDSDALGFPAVAVNIILFTIFFLILGFIIFGIDKLFARFPHTCT
ncbi:MAG TPA: Pr6Pr family membrane protein [Treponemataceae bacterium]|jgi:hypothetical protein|nr:MAG: hypothetical protein BWY39_01140 [Spirochaetes bacterium ADurb.Bin269]TAH55134.1 MAG: hypothetical protein EWM51_03860 [Treponema sp.]HOC28881.1 Pr6Pr family membrane protein [Treponemataceae bacterium]HPX46691.1 Pr6Pr family membrane protein [Treponemataceae bacterium]HQL33966.1 Pr6Pr family membrane protein [Treponemataceae bacterium]